MPHEPSLVRARYAVSLLRVIQEANFNDVIPLTTALASEYPHLNTPAAIIEMEVRAIASFKALNVAMIGAAAPPQRQWITARDAADAWEKAAAYAQLC